MTSSPEPVQGTDVLQRYALTMLEVQIFERVLALLAVTLDRKGSERAVKDAAGLKRALDRIEPRMIHVFQRASASELRKMLPVDFDAALLAEIEELIPIRDRLAHRYLVEQLTSEVGSPQGLNPQATFELAALSTRFHEATGRLIAAVRAAMLSMHSPYAPPEVRELLQQFALPMIFGERWQPPS